MNPRHLLNRWRLFYLPLCAAASGVSLGCRDYTCLDTASCPQDSLEGGVSSSDSSSQTGPFSEASGFETTSTPASTTPPTVSTPVTPQPAPASSEPLGTSTTSPTSSCDECSVGEASCTEGAQTVCELTNGCWVWSEPRACVDGACADATSCSQCTDLCQLGNTVCVDGSQQTCEVGASGCNVWSAPHLCASSECADDADCFVCDDKCGAGEARCTGGELERCQEDAKGCWDWGSPVACDPPTCATATSCVVCDDKCSAGETSCSGGSLRTCVADDLGCLDWSNPASCDTGVCSSATACLVCDNSCSAEGNTSCQSGQLRTCEADANGCLDWSAASACSTGTCASSSACFVCDDKCTSGSYSCSGSQLNECTADARGCRDFSLEATCGGNTPVCSASKGRCECESGAAPTCTNSTTVSQCTNGAWTDTACSGNTPVCVAGLGCQACTEHSQCPTTACHLAGPKKGTCFAANTVVNVNSAATLLNAVNATTANGEAVIKLSAGTYTMTSTLGPKGETAIIGQAGVVLVDNIAPPGDARVGFLSAGQTLYVSKVQIRNTSGDHTGLSVGTGAVVWIDDSQIRDEYNALISSGECHLRRMSVYNYTNGVGAYYGGSIFVENSMIGPAISGYGTNGLGAFSGGVADVRYTTVIGNDRAINCSVGNSGGRIANSLIASNLNGSSIADEYSDCSEAFTLVTNAVDQTGYGTKIPAYSSTWFTAASSGDLHLSAAGKVAIPTIAVRASGDPLLDFDGHSRPANAGYPGADQP